MALFMVGEALCRPVSEVLELSVVEIRGWVAYLKDKNGK